MIPHEELRRISTWELGRKLETYKMEHESYQRTISRSRFMPAEELFKKVNESRTMIFAIMDELDRRR